GGGRDAPPLDSWVLVCNSQIFFAIELIKKAPHRDAFLIKCVLRVCKPHPRLR
ncbi:MAG: hypothetical protein RLZZ139_3765, partial [Cyanobacteriota bacterium]